MTSWETSYWRVFNILVRVLGLVALVSGIAFTVLGAARILEQGLLLDAGAPGLVILLVGLLAGALGAAILRVPAYRPDLGDVVLAIRSVRCQDAAIGVGQTFVVDWRALIGAADAPPPGQTHLLQKPRTAGRIGSH